MRAAGSVGAAAAAGMHHMAGHGAAAQSTAEAGPTAVGLDRQQQMSVAAFEAYVDFEYCWVLAVLEIHIAVRAAKDAHST